MVLCDVYGNVQNRGKAGPSKIGTPILYYRADVSKTKHDFAFPDDSIYNYKDNDKLVDLGIPSNPTLAHVINSGGGTTPSGLPATEENFYLITENPLVSTTSRPYRSESYILMSAGFDGVYGTSDYIFNFRND